LDRGFVLYLLYIVAFALLSSLAHAAAAAAAREEHAELETRLFPNCVRVIIIYTGAHTQLLAFLSEPTLAPLLA
jgi:hypothetical protein